MSESNPVEIAQKAVMIGNTTTPIETEVVDGAVKSVTVKNSGAGFTSPPDNKKPASA